MRGKGIVVPSGAAAVVALIAGMVTLPLVAISVGMLVALVLPRRYGSQRHYDAVGTLYFLSLGVLVAALPFVPAAFKQAPALFLLVFGAVSAAIVLVKGLLRAVIDRIADRLGARRARRPVLASDLLGPGDARARVEIVKMKYRLGKTGVAGVGTLLALAFNVLGHFVNLPWFLEGGISISAMVFVGGVIVWFHALTSWYEVLALPHDPLVQAVAQRSKETASTAAERSRETAASAADRSRDIARLPGARRRRPPNGRTRPRWRTSRAVR
jgi:hypothetical protein